MKAQSRRLKKGAPDEWPSLSLLEFTIALARIMKANGDLKQKHLADLLGVSPPYISSVMAGNENLTVEQMSRLAEAAGGSLHLTIAPRGSYIRWVEDTLEETREAPISPSLHRREAMITIPMDYPLSTPQIEVDRCRSGERPTRAAAPNVSRLARPASHIVMSGVGVPLPPRRSVNLLDQSGRHIQ
jgi:transcriptional regulator with XRE-family HTH domain